MTAMSSTDTYFVAATTVTPGPTSCCTRAYAARTSSGDIADHALAAGDAAVAPVREEELRMARRAQVDALDVRAAGVAEGVLDRGREVEVAAAHDAGPEPCGERPGDLRTDLVAARTDRRADDRGGRAAERRDASLHDALEEAAPARVQERQSRRVAVRPRDGDGSAVRRELQHRERALVRPEAVARLAAAPRHRAVDLRPVLLPVQRQPRLVGADRGAQSTPVLLDALRIVGGEAAEVERRERPLADAALPRRERHLVRARRVPANQPHGCPSRRRA